ncbi:hypothetical protein KR51_00027950 [Rubidibacter lacunae KORDI 51-2]|uniref:Glycosyltransferase subfamily 4-like N-terminal domain-containing protein n=1 Tax=Rubidibacter lacunae KORDI 51-2 TaxID=582515 RepID=U5DM61_9CHRO|nr:glycosyltransferase family 4 protein [Rubidibacter lacunae]ERN40805.1 hypothetical protein KR51_00027950 [Rubidibacter lacunae KORDI 51-2]
MKILAISSPLPYPPHHGGGISARAFNLIRYLSERHEITLVTRRSPDVTDDRLQALREWVCDLIVFPQTTTAIPSRSVIERAKRLGSYLKSGTPPQVRWHYSPQMQAWIDNAVGSETFDVLTCEHTADEVYVRLDWQQRLRTILNVRGSLYGTCRQYLEAIAQERKTLRDRLDLPLLRRYEQRYCEKFSAVVATTPEDRQQLKALNQNARIAVVPDGIDLHRFPAPELERERARLVFHGAFERITVIEAARSLCTSIFPEIRRRYPHAVLELIGDRVGDFVGDWARQPGIILTATSDARSALQRATVSVQPLPFGFGIEQSVLEAMAAGIPVVGSDRALEGLPVDGPGVPLAAMRAERHEEFVYAIGRLLQDVNLQARLTANARLLITKEFTWQQIGARYEQVVAATARSLYH